MPSFLTTPMTTTMLSKILHNNKIDPDVLRYYFVGVGIGILVLAVLAIFPGTTPEDSKQGTNELLIEKEAETNGDVSETRTSDKNDAGLPANNNNSTQTKSQPPSKHQLEESEENESSNDSGWTPHQKLNTIVYLVMITVSILILNHEYNGAFSVWIYHYLFPREATFLHELFGYYHHEGSSTTAPSSFSARDDL